MFVIIGVIVAFTLDGMINPSSVTVTQIEGGYSAVSTGGPVSAIFSLAIFLPGLAVTVRRLHDIDKSGWWILIGLIPLIGIILLIVWYCTKGTLGANRFGTDPLQA